MPKKLNYDRYNAILAFIQEAKTSRQIGKHMGWEDRNTRTHLDRLVQSNLVRMFKIGAQAMQFQALVLSAKDGEIVKRVNIKPEKEVIKPPETQDGKWSPNMIVQPGRSKRLIQLHAETDALRRRELKAPKIYIGSTMGML